MLKDRVLLHLILSWIYCSQPGEWLVDIVNIAKMFVELTCHLVEYLLELKFRVTIELIGLFTCRTQTTCLQFARFARIVNTNNMIKCSNTPSAETEIFEKKTILLRTFQKATEGIKNPPNCKPGVRVFSHF